MQAAPSLNHIATRLDRNLFGRGLLRPLNLFISFEFLFVLFIFAGTYKQNPALGWVFPIDPTLMFFAASLGVGVLILFRDGIYRPGLVPIAFYVLLVAWIMLSSFWTLAPEFSIVKDHVMRIAILNSWVVIGICAIVASSRVRVMRFLTLVVLLALVLGADYVINAGSFSHRGFLEDRQYQQTARVVSWGLIVTAGMMMFERLTSMRWLVYAAVSIGLFYALMIIGGRLPLLSALLMVFFMFVLQFKISERGARTRKSAIPVLLIGVGVITFISVMIASGTDSWTLQRLGKLFAFFSGDIERDNSAGTRLAYVLHAIEFWTASLQSFLIGNGLASFSYMYIGRYIPGTNPHNVPLEILSEFGAVGIVLFGGYVLSILSSVPPGSRTQGALPIVLMGLAGALTLYILVSSDMLSLYWFFAFFGLLPVLAKKPVSLVQRPARFEDEPLEVIPKGRRLGGPAPLSG